MIKAPGSQKMQNLIADVFTPHHETVSDRQFDKIEHSWQHSLFHRHGPVTGCRRTMQGTLLQARAYAA
jgi:hypothetical protein